MIQALALLVLAGCAISQAEPAPAKQLEPPRAKQLEPPRAKQPEPPPAKRFEQNMAVRFHMHENFGLLHTIQKFLVHGKLDEARSLATAMAQAPDEPGLSAWSVEATRVRERAALVASATTVDDALRQEARLAEACASCHVESGSQPEFSKAPATPPDRPTLEARMARHLWASDRLWEGMLGSSDEQWQSGLDVLAASPLPASELGTERTALARKLQRLAAEARKRPAGIDSSTRAAAYGEILVTCASCHAKKPASDPPVPAKP